MDSLVTANVRRSCQLIAHDTSSFSDEVSNLASQVGSQLPIVLGKGRATSRPIFFKSGDRIACEQHECFGFYLLREAIRGCLSSVNFQAAGTVLLNDELFAPAVSLFYTSAFHSVASFLAMNGRVLIDMETYHWYSAPLHLTTKPEVIAACLTKDNRWIFECRRRSHVARWNELQFVFTKRGFLIPDYFRDLFREIFPTTKGGTGLAYLEEVLENRESSSAKNRAELEDYLEGFLRKISEIRHQGLYHASGEDPYAQEALVNGMRSRTRGLDRLTRTLGEFAKSLLGEVAESVCELLNQVTLSPERAATLLLGLGYPFRDALKLDLLGEKNEIATRISYIEEWLQKVTKDRASRTN